MKRTEAEAEADRLARETRGCVHVVRLPESAEWEAHVALPEPIRRYPEGFAVCYPGWWRPIEREQGE